MSQLDTTTFGPFIYAQIIFFATALQFFSIAGVNSFFTFFFLLFSFFTCKNMNFIFIRFLKIYFKAKISDLPLPWQVEFQDSASSQMEGIVDLYADLMAILFGVLLFVCYTLISTIWVWNLNINLIRNKYFLHPKTWYYFNFHPILEIVWTIMPAFILIIIGILSFSLLFSLEDDFGTSIWIKVIGSQWYWAYEYYSGTEVISTNSFMIPEEELTFGQLRLLQVDNWLVFYPYTPIKFFVTSQDVLHSWAIPSFGVKVDACPGRLNAINVFTKRSGYFYGQCSEICGVNHAFMPIVIQITDVD